jgi:hypothetical protein
MSSILRAAIVAVIAAVCACGGGTDSATQPRTPRPSIVLGVGRPPLSLVERDGDARGAVAFAVTTEGIAPDRPALVAVALAAIIEDRIAAHGVADATAVGGWNGWRMRALVSSPADAAKLTEIARDAMLTPIASADPSLAAVARKLAALAQRPMPDRALIDVARCTGEAYGIGDEGVPTAAELEAWRRSAHGLGRVAISAAGDASFADAVAQALARAPAWPKGAPLIPSPWPAADTLAIVYDASGEVPPGAARIVVTARTTAPERAAAAAPMLGNPRGPLASRLAALDAPAIVRSIIATAHVDGGCVATTVDLSARDLASDAPARVATAAVLARQEIAVEIADVGAPAGIPRAIAAMASDPREAAERAAWWGLAGRRAAGDEMRLGLMVGLAATRDNVERGDGGAANALARSGGRTALALGETLRAEIDRATLASHAPVVDARTRVEQGQGETWVLLASTCGTLPEAVHDAGAGAAVATAAAMQSEEAAGDARVEPFVATDGVGVLAHGPGRADESPDAHARRLADIAGRAFAADVLDPDRVSRARTALLARAAQPEVRALGALGVVLAPGHPSWIAASGTIFGLASSSDDAIAMRAATVRAGPLRVAVVANKNAAQADAGVRAVDRWIARRPGDARACPSVPTVPAARPGTYAVPLPPGAPSEALLAVSLATGDDAARTAAVWMAAALDGPGGLLARAVGAPSRGDPSAVAMARSWSSAVVGVPRSPALVIRLSASEASLDAAVAQTRGLLDRLRQGALQEEDRARAANTLASAALAASLDPRARAIDLWRGRTSSPPPSLDGLRAFAAAMLHDDALVIIALRPARGDADRPSATVETKPGATRPPTRD